LAAAAAASAQRHKLGTINAETPEGQLLQQIGTESDEAKKLALLEDFAAKYPKHEGVSWVYEQLVGSYTKAGQYDKVVETGEKAIAIDPADVDTAYACLQAAEAKKDPAMVIKWSGATSEAARKIVQSPKPTEADEAEEWTRRVDFAKQVDVRSEYSLYAAMLQTTDPKQKIALGEALERRNPQSQYLPQMADQRFQAYVQAGDAAKAVALAQKTVAAGQGSVEMLLALASDAMSKKQADQAVGYSKKAIEAAEAKPKPEGVADADWQSWKTQVTGNAHWIAGRTYAGQNKWSATDQELRAALPGVKANREMLAEALFYAGLANYRLAEAGDHQRARDALKFSEECAAIPGRFQVPARTNVKAIRSQYHIQ
jgi:tetratricopeptide (TPR) repeat protein